MGESMKHFAMHKMHILFIFFFHCVSNVTAAKRTAENSCPEKVLEKHNNLFLQVHDDSCFLFLFNKRRTYHQARDDCRKDGGTLALPKSKALNNYLTETTSQHYGIVDPVWIGLHDMRSENKFVWEDNSKMGWSNFASGNGPSDSFLARFDPRGNVEDCVAIHPTDGKWHDYQCNDIIVAFITDAEPLKPYICQYPLKSLDNQDDQQDTDQDKQDTDQDQHDTDQGQQDTDQDQHGTDQGQQDTNKGKQNTDQDKQATDQGQQDRDKFWWNVLVKPIP